MNLVSIIIPVYNQEKYLKETLQSVINQAYSNWECILVNDGSMDNSVEIINEHVAQDNRFHFINSENKGVSNARNLALQQAKGDCILFLDGDDLIHPEKISQAISNFQKNADLSIVFNTTSYFQDVMENKLYDIKIDAELLNFNDLLLYWGEKIIIPIHSAIIKKSLLDGIEFNTDLTAQEDWLVWLRLFQKNPKVLVLDKTLSFYRKHNSSRTQTVSLKEDHFKALELFEKYIGSENHEKLLIHQIERYYLKSYDNAFKLDAIRKSKTYRAAIFVKKMLAKLKLLGIIKLLSAKFFKDEK
ncbi:glycosyltransferase family 2 protein [Flavobacterium terrigena]|uniref:Glycosyl transferase family 2 n=1 Tax=Flavobacterium terrigena TaxID=402734 RepID=A0A1H6R5E6_9FLAO|nr:glycosyltransferase family 2 protein [Flavobacterium terrigena]SEI48444.1 Glycosyl transferase family 2 [Flavobacterium terrigena]